MPRAHATPIWGRLVLVAGSVAFTGAALAQTAAPTAHSEDESVALTPLIVSASRTPQDPRFVSSAVTPLFVADLQARQVPSLADALASVPGVALVRTGAYGGQASLFIRGAASHQTLFVVDGVRMNDRSASYFNTLGSAALAGYDRIEVLRGPQSTLYGSNAVGGIILLNTTQGCGPFNGKVGGLTGSDNTWAAAVAAQGGTRNLGYSAHVDRYSTDNVRPWNQATQTGGSTRIEYAPTQGVIIGATARISEGHSQEPGSLFYSSRGRVNTTNHLATAYVGIESGEVLSSRLTLAQHARHYLYREWGNSDMRNRRRILDWQTTYAPSTELEVTGGVNLETSRYIINGAAQADRVQAGFVSSTYRPLQNVILTAGLRYDDFQTFSSTTTGRGGLTWLITADTKARATYGTGFIAPGIDDRYGVAGWGQLPNPNLRPERARGWDVGIDHTFTAVPATVSLTYFQNRIRDLFEWTYVNFTTFEGQITNRARARTEGLEFASSLTVAKVWRLQGSYTYVDARDAATQARLTRRPHHLVDGSVLFVPSETWQLGVGSRLAAGRTDTGGRLPAYATWRAFGQYRVLPNLLLQARVENALDRAYEEVLGYPALPRQVFAGVEWSF